MILVPKKVNGLLEKKFGILGWGVQAVSGLALRKCVVAVLLSQIPTTIFANYSLADLALGIFLSFPSMFLGS